MSETLGDLARELAGTWDGDREARFVRRGADVVVRFTYATDAKVTETEVALPAIDSLELHVRRHEMLDKNQIEQEMMIDAQLGDAAFDKAFLVEAAPFDVVRTLVDASVREVLVALDHPDLKLWREPARSTLRLTTRRWMRDRDQVARVLDLMATLANRIRETGPPSDEGKGQLMAVEQAHAKRLVRAKHALGWLVAVVGALIALGLALR